MYTLHIIQTWEEIEQNDKSNYLDGGNRSAFIFFFAYLYFLRFSAMDES